MIGRGVADELAYDAVVRNVQIIGEEAKHVPVDIRQQMSAKPSDTHGDVGVGFAANGGRVDRQSTQGRARRETGEMFGASLLSGEIIVADLVNGAQSTRTDSAKVCRHHS